MPSVAETATPVQPMRILHVGCGRKQLPADDLMMTVGLSPNQPRPMTVTHLDADPRLEPDIVCELGLDPIDLPSESVDLVIAWHVLEHVGQQGQSEEWFYAWEELYRVLAPGGVLYGECPYYTSVWAWGDPTHTRAISEKSFIFFNQDNYRIDGSMISPYRIRADFQVSEWRLLRDPQEPKHTSIRFLLQARKPLRPWWED